MSKIECTCNVDQREGVLKGIHSVHCAISRDRHRRSYRELIGNKCRGNKHPPVELPDKCPVCDAKATVKKDGQFAKRMYECGGSYSMKPQIQNHTDYFWGSCKAR